MREELHRAIITVLLLSGGVAALSMGCGPDDPPEPAPEVGPVDTGETDAGDAGEDTAADSTGDADTSADADEDVDACQPLTCQEAPAQCGTLADGCGGTLDCGECSGPATCGEVAPNMCNCAPESDEEFCSRLGKTCGRVTAEDNCGFERTATCGSCGENQECKPDNTCGCVPEPDRALCSENNLGCGTKMVEGRCGTREVSCGQCDAQPGGTCVNNSCVCKPFTCSDAEIQGECGIYPNGCGGQIRCEGGCEETLLTTGGYHTCYSDSTSNRLKCWGWNKYGQLGIGSNDKKRYNTPQTVRTKFNNLYTLTAGENYTCVVDGGTAKCWGANHHGQVLGSENDAFGNELTEVLLPRTPNVPGVGINQIEAGVEHTCAINTAGEAYCWGSNSSAANGTGEGVLMGGPANPANPRNPAVGPTRYSFGPTGKATDIDAGLFHTCGEASDGTLWCWGIGFFGGLGAGPGYFNLKYTAPVKVSGFANGFGQVETGGLDQKKDPNSASLINDFSCAIDANNAAKCWGSDAFRGELGNGGNNQSEPSPVQVQGLGQDVQDLALGGGHACAIQNTNVWCWGGNEFGQVGNGKSGAGEQEDVPVQVSIPGSSDPVDIEAGFYHTCVQLRNEKLVCWGRNSDGQLGDGTFDNASTPKVVVP